MATSVAATSLPRELLDEGVRLATARRPAMLQLMREHPQRALEESLNWHAWAALPASIHALVEEPFSAMADFEVEMDDASTGPSLESDRRCRVVLRGTRFNASVYGRRLHLATKHAVPLQGILLGDQVALWESAVRHLAGEDMAVARRRFSNGSAPTRSWWSGQPLGDNARAALCGGKLYWFASEAEAQAFADTLASAEKGLGPNTVREAMAASGGGDVFDASTFGSVAEAISSAWTEGAKKVLCLRYQYTPAINSSYTLSQSELFTNMLVCSNAIREMSYAKTWLVPTMAPELFVLPGSAQDYDWDPLTSVLDDVATNGGYNLDDYDFIVYVTPHTSAKGRANIAGRSQRIFGHAIPAIHAHEFGHNYGLEHASFWNETSGNGFAGHLSGDQYVEHTTYGDIYDIMGADRYDWPDGSITFPNGHYSMHGKAHLNWIEPAEVTTVTVSGTYRIYRFDHRSARSGTHRLALKVTNTDGQELWVGFRRNFAFNDSIFTGAYIVWGYTDAGHRLLDTTPLSWVSEGLAKDREDAALTPGRTYTDSSGSVRITNLGWGGTAPYEYLDLEVTLGSGFEYPLSFGVFTNATLTRAGLTGSYVNHSLEGYSTQDDWRSSQTIAGTRRDLFPAFVTEGWGSLDVLGLTHFAVSQHGEVPPYTYTTNYNDFSVQWDGWLSVPRPMRFATISDDGSRMWIDLNGDGAFDPTGPEFIDNHWSQTQGATLGEVSPIVLPGTYALRIQYYDVGSDDYLLLCGAPATNVWVGNVSGNWGTGANWSAGVVPGDGEDLVFPEGAVRLVTTNNTSTTRRYRSMLIAGGGYLFRGNSLSLSNGLAATYDTGTSTVELPITLRAPQAFQCTVSGLSVNVTGDVDLGSHTLTVDGEGNVRLGGVVSGTGGVTKNGTGLLFLEGSGLNTYTGMTRVNEGRLMLDKSAIPAIPNGELIIGDGVGGADADRVVANRNSQIGTIPITFYSSGLLDLEGYSDMVGAIEFNGGHITTGGEFTTGTLTLGGNVTGNATARGLIDGQVEISVTRTFNIANASGSPDLELRAVVIGTGGIIKNGAGALGLYGSNTFTGQVTVNDGLLYTYHPMALGSTAAGTLVNSGGVLAIVDGTALAAEPLTLNGSGDGISGAVASAGGSNSCAGLVTLASDSVITVRTNCYLNLTGVVAGPGSLIKRQPGTLILSGASANTFAGDALVEEGFLEMNKSAVNGAVPGTLQIGTDSGPARSVVARNLRASQCDVVVVNASGLYDLHDYGETLTDLTLNLGGDVQTGSGTLTLGSSSHVSVNHNILVLAGVVSTISGNLNVGTGSRRFIVSHGQPPILNPVDLDIAAVVSGSAAVIKEGAGIMGLTTPNTFTGALTVSNGTVRLTDSAALGTTNGGTIVNPGAQLALAGGVDVAGETLTFAGVGTGTLFASDGSNTWTGGITLQSAATVNVLGVDNALNLTGVIGGTGNLTKTGSGTLTFSGLNGNTYSGRTMVSAGTLELNKTGTTAVVGDLDIGDGSGGAQADVVRLLRGSQIANTRVTVADSGLFNLNGSSDTIGSLIGSGVVDTGGGALNTGYDNTSTTFSGQIVGTGGRFTKYGSGTCTLTGTNTYTGFTTVGSGTLLVNGFQPASPVQVVNPRILGGSGTVGHITNSGTLAPGASAGLLTCSNLAFAGAGAALAVELNGLSAGTSYDRVNARGTVNLSNATLQVSVGCAPAEGDQFRIINNDGTDAVLGTFTGLPEGTLVSAGGLQFRVSYIGGTGNDVVLMVTNTALAGTTLTLLTGNGNGVLDVTECNLLNIAVTNRAATTVTGITAVLTTTTPGVWITQPESPYPNLASGGVGTNTRPFQLTTLPGFACGTNVELELIVTTSNHGAFTVPLVLPTGSQGPLVRYDNNTAAALFDPGAYDSAVVVTNLTVPLAKVMVSASITHPKVEDLDLYLLAPDGTTIELSTDNGGTGDNYGQSSADNQRAFFDDDAKYSITTQSAPFVGTFKPETPLSVLRGRLLNGTWRLRVSDDTAGNAGTLNCWSLHLYPATCTGGGGPCAPCPDQTIAGTITATDPSTMGRLQLNHVASSCGSPKACPGVLSDGGTRRCDLYPFLNGASNACVTVTLATTNALFTAVYTNWFAGGSDLCANYLADPGEPGSRSCSFDVAVGGAFVVVVSELSPGSSAAGGDYTLSVTGGSCLPRLDIERAGGNRVVLTWPVFASDFRLERTPALNSVSNSFTPVVTVPFVLNREFMLTNTIAATNRYYRLHKP